MSWYADVFDLVFPDLDPDAANNIWKDQLADKEKTASTKEPAEEED